MSVLVTGGAGYIGSVVVDTLIEAGEKVVVLDDLSTGLRERVPRGVAFYKGKCGDRKLIGRIMDTHGITECIHMAAMTDVRANDPYMYFKQNVDQSAELFDALQSNGCTRFVFSSSCAAEFPQASAYGWSKKAVEDLLAFYAEAYDTNHVILRYYNAAGATERIGQTRDTHLIPIVLAVANGERPYLEVYGSSLSTADGSPMRDYIHVSDLADAHVRAIKRLRSAPSHGRFDLGSGEASSVLRVVKVAQHITGKKIPVVFGEPRPQDQEAIHCTDKDASLVLGWEPTHSDLYAIIQSAWEWKCTQ